MTDEIDELDEIDRTILRIIAQDPRVPYSDIAEQLEEEGHEMSSEGIRYRVSNLFETASILLLTAPQEHGWEVIRLFIEVDNAPSAKQNAFEELSEMGVWMSCRLHGTMDLYAVATVRSTQAADELLEDVRAIDNVTRVEHAIETVRETEIDNYLAL
ncbi:Lrp/AsnC family transcriptional regulator [Halovenus marina]|jgi:DNA-binding Lrp family transcriptional regulator|uniref:Lrp/AsnC family transcriptional regulator n=1 Tax=Halovenus marina TaxID=3396621 RepID=UPI003F55EBC9